MHYQSLEYRKHGLTIIQTKIAEFRDRTKLILVLSTHLFLALKDIVGHAPVVRLHNLKTAAALVGLTDTTTDELYKIVPVYSVHH